RVIAATNVDLEAQVRQGKFREDLYYRLNTVPIQVPSLKERREDIPILFRKFAVDFAEKYRTEPIRLDEQAELLLKNYRWPGNIRELKNVAEQLSVLAETRRVTADDIINIIPNILERNLPMIPDSQSGEGSGLKEREILYKLLFEMKSDMNELKSLVFDLIQRNNLSAPADLKSLKPIQSNAYPEANYPAPISAAPAPLYSSGGLSHEAYEAGPANGEQPILIRSANSNYTDVEEVDENLSLEEMEKELIQKALKKHNGRRKDAAQDLGISERTLYRKIKQYEL
ncbi:MAG: sigma-54-dependent Fis family transcriptional regulator, partial [Phaeodactylibacter sp.]|nr:sigma-54-dependent Fis family transcriptional regulator [Phaeodactylibacter sp.]